MVVAPEQRAGGSAKAERPEYSYSYLIWKRIGHCCLCQSDGQHKACYGVKHHVWFKEWRVMECETENQVGSERRGITEKIQNNLIFTRTRWSHVFWLYAERWACAFSCTATTFTDAYQGVKTTERTHQICLEPSSFEMAKGKNQNPADAFRKPSPIPGLCRMVLIRALIV